VTRSKQESAIQAGVSRVTASPAGRSSFFHVGCSPTVLYSLYNIFFWFLHYSLVENFKFEWKK